ncbi:MAG: hypothetical protein WCW84_04780 [Sulfurimonas sp.]
MNNKNFKPVSNWIFAGPIIVLFSSIIIQDKFFKSEEPIQKNQVINVENNQEKGIIKLGDKYHIYNVEEHGEVKYITDIISRDCKGKEVCEIDQAFKYVTNKPYTVSIKDRTPQEVIKVGGDCDEKSFLFASILVERKHKCVIVYTKDHAFVAVYLKDRANLYSHTASLEIDGKYYFYAETTAKNTHIGWFNGVKKESILGVYDVNEKKEIGLDRIALNIN